MLKAVTAFAVRRRVAVLAAAPLLLAVAAFAGSGAADRFGSGGFHAARNQSTLAGAFLDRNFDDGPVNFVLLVRTPSSVDQPATVQAGRAMTARLADERGVGQVVSYWSGGQPAALLSRDGRSALITARVLGNEDQVASRVRTLYPAYTGTHDGLTVQVGGQPAAERELVSVSEHDLRISELAAAPVVALVLLVVFGGGVAASLPLLVGLVAVLSTLATLNVLSAFTDGSLFSLSITAALGFGLAALLAVLGPRVDALPLRGLTRRAEAGKGAHRALMDRHGGRVRTGVGSWHRLSTIVVRRPVHVGLAVVTLLLVLGAPFAQTGFALPDNRLAPVSSEAHQVTEALRDDYPQVATDAAYVVAPLVPHIADHWGAVEAYAIALSRVRGVDRVDAMTGSYADGNVLQVATLPDPHFVSRDKNATWLSLVTRVQSYSSAGQQLARDVRAVPAGFDVYVGGHAAQLVDTRAALLPGLPYAFLILGFALVIVFFMFTGRILVPVKAVVLNLLSLTATFGAMVWGFQDGHLRPLVGDFQPAGTLELTIPILMFCIAFGLSMSYVVFLLSRIKEEYDRSGDNRAVFSLGLARTRRLMRIVGHASWRATPLRRLHSRIGLAETGASPAPAVARQRHGLMVRIGRPHRPTVDTLHWCSRPTCPVSDSELAWLEGLQEV
jgi:putative drug exporter of the RND superfamily